MMKKLSPGQKLQISAGTWNNLIDDYSRRRDLGAGLQHPKQFFENGVDIQIRNDTGANLIPGATVDVNDYALADLDRKYLWFSGTVPTSTTNTFGICLKAIPDGEQGPVRIAGVAPAWVSFSDAAHTRAILSPGNTYLDSAPEVIGEGAKVISKPAGDGLLFVPIYLPYTSQPPLVYFQLYDNKTLSSQPTLAKVLAFNGTTWVDSGIFINLYDDYYNAPGFFTGKANVDRGWAKLRKKAADPDDPDDYEIVWMSGPAHRVDFTTTADRLSGSAAAVNATIDGYYLYGHDQLAPTSIWFPAGWYPNAITGAKGKATYDDRNIRYVVDVCDQLCLHAKAIVKEAFCGDSATAVVEALTAETPFPFSQVPAVDVDGDNNPIANTWTFSNTFNHQGKIGDLVWLEWSQGTGTYEVTDVTKHEWQTALPQVLTTRTDHPGEDNETVVNVLRTYYYTTYVEVCANYLDQDLDLDDCDTQ